MGGGETESSKLETELVSCIGDLFQNGVISKDRYGDTLEWSKMFCRDDNDVGIPWDTIGLLSRKDAKEPYKMCAIMILSELIKRFEKKIGQSSEEDSNSDRIKCYLFRGRFYGWNSQFMLAIEDFTKGIGLVTESGCKEEEYELYYWRGVSYKNIEKFENARNDLLKVLESPDYPRSYSDRSRDRFDLMAYDLLSKDGVEISNSSTWDKIREISDKIDKISDEIGEITGNGCFAYGEFGVACAVELASAYVELASAYCAVKKYELVLNILHENFLVDLCQEALIAGKQIGLFQASRDLMRETLTLILDNISEITKEHYKSEIGDISAFLGRAEITSNLANYSAGIFNTNADDVIEKKNEPAEMKIK